VAYRLEGLCGAQKGTHMNDDSHPDRARDERNLAAVRDANADGDEVALRDALTELVVPYWGWARTIAYSKLDGVDNRGAEADAIAQEVIAELVTIVKREDIAIPFHLLASINLKFFIKRFFRTRQRTRSDPVAEIPPANEVEVGDDQQSLARQAMEFAPYLDGLSERDRELVTERMFLGLTPEQSAARHGISREALDVAYHRALNRLRKNLCSRDVRKPDEGVA
jgi:RNA polymerase sigma-70 factor, ECF subfamily